MAKSKRLPGHKVKLPNWEMFVTDVLKGHALLFVEGGHPDKIFEVCTHAGAQKALDILTRLKIKNYVLFSVEGYDHATLLMATGMILKDIPDSRIYVEDKIAYISGKFPRITSGKPDKVEWRGFMEEMRA